MVDPVGKQNQGNVVLPLAVSAGKLSLNVLTTALFFKINLASTWFLPFSFKRAYFCCSLFSAEFIKCTTCGTWSIPQILNSSY